MMTLATARANVTALESLAVGDVEEVTITTDAGTRRIKRRSIDDVLKQLNYWSRVVAQLERAARRQSSPARVRFG